MAATLDFFDTYTLLKVFERAEPKQTFFKDRYFPTRAGDIFDSDKVLVEYSEQDSIMAPFVSERIGDVPAGREDYSVYEFEPPYVGMSKTLTIDDLKKRGFGEALYAKSTPAQRAARLQLDDMIKLDRAITRREEWMSVQTMLNNGCEVQEYIDAKTKGPKRFIKFYDGTSDHVYTVANKWNSPEGNLYKDVCAMGDQLVDNGLDAEDLLLGVDAADVFFKDKEIRALLDATLKINAGALDEKIIAPGITHMGRMNFDGHDFNIIKVNETYKDENGVRVRYFPATSAMVSAPGCGHMMYGRISQIPYLGKNVETYAKKRVPKVLVEDNVRKLRLGAKPLAAPLNYCPYIHAPNVVG